MSPLDYPNGKRVSWHPRHDISPPLGERVEDKNEESVKRVLISSHAGELP
jgi:hypothetical protein